jgi:hypothetical protein
MVEMERRNRGGRRRKRYRRNHKARELVGKGMKLEGGGGEQRGDYE